MRARIALVAAVAGLTSTSAASACTIAPLGIPGPTSPAYTLRAPVALQGELRQVAHIVRQAFTIWPPATGLGTFPRGPRPFPVVLVAPGEIPGLNGQYGMCGGRRAVAVAGGLPIARRARIMVHELFHAFQAALDGDGPDYWWAEATADWASWTLTSGIEDEGPERDAVDAALLQHPDLPMDEFSPGSQHPYGAWRFVAFLRDRVRARRMAPFGHLLRDSFRMIGAGRAPTTAVRRALRDASDLDLDRELGRFWGRRLASRDGMVPGRTDLVPLLAGESKTLRLDATRPLAARLLRVVPSPGVGKVVVRTPPLDLRNSLWVETNEGLNSWTRAGREQVYCLTGTPTGPEQQWQKWKAAFTRGELAPPGAPIQVVATAEGCEEPEVPDGSTCRRQAGASCPIDLENLFAAPQFGGRGFHYLDEFSETLGGAFHYHRVEGRHCGPDRYGLWRFLRVSDDYDTVRGGRETLVYEWTVNLTRDGAWNPVTYTNWQTVTLLAPPQPSLPPGFPTLPPLSPPTAADDAAMLARANEEPKGQMSVDEFGTLRSRSGPGGGTANGPNFGSARWPTGPGC